MMSNVDVNELVEIYLEIRTKRDEIKRQYEAHDLELKSDLEELETAMMGVCNEMNVNSINTNHGTIIRKINERYVCSDWDNFRQFVLENEAVDLFEKRIHQGNFRQFMEDHKDDGLPPGINVMREFDISVRKATKK
jgi:hypothetical protein